VEPIDAAARLGLALGRGRHAAVQKLRAREDARDSRANPFLEPACLVAVSEKAHDGLELVRLDRAAIGAAREPGEDLLRARRIFVGALRIAGEDLFAARRVADA